MSERQVTIGSKVGLHARPASLFAKAVKDAGVPVQIAKDGKPPVNAASLLSLLTLGAEFGEQRHALRRGRGRRGRARRARRDARARPRRGVNSAIAKFVPGRTCAPGLTMLPRAAQM